MENSFVNVKLVCMDLDGTLFGTNGEIPEVNIRALKECERRGIFTALVSGRGHAFMKRTAERIGVKCALVSANGARVEASGDGPTISEITFSKAEGTKVFSLLKTLNVNFEAYTRNANYVVNESQMPSVHRASLMKYVASGDVEAVFDEKRADEEAPSRAYKFVAFSDKEEILNRVRHALDEWGIAHCSSWSNNVEIMPAGVGKGEAVRILASYYRVDVRDCMAFGDYTNDLDMLKACGHPVAMENGVDELKQAAEIIAPDHREGGVGQVIFKYVLKEPMIP